MSNVQPPVGTNIQVRIQAEGRPDDVRNFRDAGAAMDWVATGSGGVWRAGALASVTDPADLTLATALERYSREVTPNKKGAANEMRRVRMWQRHPLGNKLLTELRPTDFAGFRDMRLAQNIAGNTVRLDLALIQSLFGVARLDWGVEGLGNPIKDIRKPKVSRGRDRRLRGDEEQRLLARYRERGNRRHEAIFQLALETAMRRSELVGLRWEDVRLDDRVATLPDTKNGERRDVPLSTHAVQVLRSLEIRNEGRVFEVHPDNVTLRFREACKAKGIVGLRFHDLRHEATSRFFEKGLNMMEVAAITGHKTLQMLKRYTHLRAKDLAAKLG